MVIVRNVILVNKIRLLHFFFGIILFHEFLFILPTFIRKQQMIAERQNREKPTPKRKKKQKIIEAITKNELNQYDDDEDDDKDDEGSDNEKDSINDAIAETNEALTVITSILTYIIPHFIHSLNTLLLLVLLLL